MFNYKHYVPVLKAKEGELKALDVTSSKAKDNMTPLLEIVKIPWDYKKNAYSKTIEGHLTPLAKKINKVWQKRNIFIDSPFMDGDTRMSDGITHHFSFLFDEFRILGLNAIPVTGLRRHADYKDSVRDISATDSKGICLRLHNIDFTNPNLKNLIDADLAFYGLKTTEIDLVIDLASIYNGADDLLSISLSTVINTKIPYINKWRTLTICATAFPQNLAGFSGGSISRCDRVEWSMWLRLLSNNLKRNPSFGDYSISHPDMLDMNPLLMTMSASIRYTADDEWIIVKGMSVKSRGFAQYHALSSQLIALPEYCGSTYSWGDDYINQCAAVTVSTGNATTWRQVGNNHHFEKVAHQLSMIP